MAGKKTTIEDLARMVARGFSETATKVQMVKVEDRLTKVEDRLENIEKILLRQQNEKIQNMERRINRLEEMFAVK